MIKEGDDKYTYEGHVNDTPMIKLDLQRQTLGDLILVEIKAQMDGNQISGTGLLISPTFVLTAAHMIYCREVKKCCKKITTKFVDLNGYLHQRQVNKLFYKRQHEQEPEEGEQKYQYDYGLLQLDQPSPVITKQSEQKTGWKTITEEFFQALNQIKNKEDKAMILGFDVSKEGQQAESPRLNNQLKKLNISTGTLKISEEKLLKYEINTTSGMSGGVIIQFIDQHIVLLGLHVGCKYRTAVKDIAEYNIGFPRQRFEPDVINTFKSAKLSTQKLFQFEILEKLIEARVRRDWLVKTIVKKVESSSDRQNMLINLIKHYEIQQAKLRGYLQILKKSSSLSTNPSLCEPPNQNKPTQHPTNPFKAVTLTTQAIPPQRSDQSCRNILNQDSEWRFELFSANTNNNQPEQQEKCCPCSPF